MNREDVSLIIASLLLLSLYAYAISQHVRGEKLCVSGEIFDAVYNPKTNTTLILIRGYGNAIFIKGDWTQELQVGHTYILNLQVARRGQVTIYRLKSYHEVE